MKRFTKVGLSSSSGTSVRGEGGFFFGVDPGLNGPLKGPVRTPRVAVATLRAEEKEEIPQQAVSGSDGVVVMPEIYAFYVDKHTRQGGGGGVREKKSSCLRQRLSFCFSL